jgi:phospholipid-binding lipoprotein MlaA
MPDSQTVEEAQVQASQPDSQFAEEQPSSPEAIDESDNFSDYSESDGFEDDYDSDEDRPVISDPLEPINRAFFVFNDKLYFWFLKPVAKGYSVIAPIPVRSGIKNFFSNLGFPIRFVNCLLQAKFSGAGYEFERFFINSTLGLAGFIDMADKEFGVKAFDEDFGQTLGVYGLGQGFYINWPFFGPSSVLETFGMAGDYFLDPTYNLDLKFRESVALKGYKAVNSTSLGDFYPEDLKKSALDPYVAFRDFYIRYRQNKIKE